MLEPLLPPTTSVRSRRCMAFPSFVSTPLWPLVWTITDGSTVHTDHCAKKLLPWLDGMLDEDERFFKQNGIPLFSSHMIDLVCCACCLAHLTPMLTIRSPVCCGKKRIPDSCPPVFLARLPRASSFCATLI